MTDHELIIEAAKLDGCYPTKICEHCGGSGLVMEKDYVGWETLFCPNRGNHVSGDEKAKNCRVKSYEQNLPPYLTSRDAIVRVIEKQPLEIKRKIAHEFYGRPRVGGCIEDDYIDCICASARRLTIALVKAAGTYKE